MEAGGFGWEYGEYREVVQQAQEILMRERAFSADEAYGYLSELAQARKVFIVEVANQVVVGDWFQTGVLQEMTPTDAGKWFGLW
jgi:hypothetical protein